MVRRRRVPPAGPTRAKPDPEIAEMVTRPPEPFDETDTGPTLPVETHASSIHDTLLETVSAEALQSHNGTTAEPVAETLPGPVESGPAASATPAPDTGPEPEAYTPTMPVANDPEPAMALPVPSSPAPIVVPMRPVPVPAFRRASALDALGELSETNATVVAFLRNEGTATLAHWRSLAGAKSPADAVRLQVDEMQRAADASLTCLNSLARRAGRFAGILARR